MLLSTPTDTIFRIILWKDNLSWWKNLFLKVQVTFLTITSVYSLWYDIQNNFKWKESFRKKVFQIIFSFFLIDIPVYRHWYRLQIIFFKIDLSIESFPKNLGPKFLHCCCVTAVMRTSVQFYVTNDFSILKVFKASKFPFFAVVPVYSHWYDPQKNYKETIFITEIFSETSTFGFPNIQVHSFWYDVQNILM